MRLVVGVGMRSSCPPQELVDLVRGTLDGAGLALARVDLVATVSSRRDAAAVRGLAAVLGVPVVGFPAEELAAVEVPHPSGLVASRTGTGSVCEAAVLAAGASLVVGKQRSARATCAVGRLEAAAACAG